MGKLVVLVLVGVVGMLWFLNAKETPADVPAVAVAEKSVDISKAPREVIDPFDGVSGAVRKPGEAIEKLTFSNTMRLGDQFRAFLDDPARVIGANEKRIGLPDFPANSSLRTEKELALLHEYVALRTPERVAQILAEREADGIKVGPEMITTYMADARYAKTGEAIGQLLDEINPVVMRIKNRYDRVRAHKLDPTLTTVIDVPEHGAYPSGHSTQAHSIAFLLTAIAPERKAEFESDALRVAVNREIAGVHYPSDSAAGRLLARQIVDLMLQNPEYARLVESAKGEWGTK